MTCTRIKSGAAVALTLISLAATAADAPQLVATSIKGEVIRHAGSVQSSVTEKATIDAGEIVETRARSGVQLDFRGAIDLTLGPGAALMYHSAEGQQLRVKLGAGDFEALIARDADLRFNVGPLRARAVGARIAARVRSEGSTVCVLQGAASVQTPAGEKKLDKPGQCLERNGDEEVVRGPGSPGAHPLPPVPDTPMVGATALPPPPPAALSSQASSPTVPQGMATSMSPVASAAPPPPAPTPTQAAPAAAAPTPILKAPSPAAAARVAPAPVVASAPPAAAVAPASPPVVAVPFERAPRIASTIAMKPQPVVATMPAVATAAAVASVPAAAPAAPATAPTLDVTKIGKPSSVVVITSFAEAPEVTGIVMNPQAVTATPPPAAPVASPPRSSPAPQAKTGAAVDMPALAAGWTVVIAALNSYEGANEEVKRLRANGLPADIFVFSKDGQRVWRLGLGRFNSYEAAAVYITRVRKQFPEYQPWIAAFGAAPN